MMAVAWTIGPLIGGPAISRLKMNIPRTLAVIVLVHSVVLFGYLTAMLLDCPEAPWAGTVTQQGSVTTKRKVAHTRLPSVGSRS